MPGKKIPVLQEKMQSLCTPRIGHAPQPHGYDSCNMNARLQRREKGPVHLPREVKRLVTEGLSLITGPQHSLSKNGSPLRLSPPCPTFSPCTAGFRDRPGQQCSLNTFRTDPSKPGALGNPGQTSVSLHSP